MVKINKEEGVVTIEKSYLTVHEELMLYALLEAEAEEITERSMNSLIREWKTHNILFKLGLFKSHTKDTDFERKEKLHRRICYFLIAPFYKMIMYN